MTRQKNLREISLTACVNLLFTLGCWSVLCLTSWPRILPALTKEDQEIHQLVQSKLKNKGDTVLRTLDRIGNQTIVLEAFLASEADPRLAGKIFSDLNRFGTWALPGINDRPSGGKYYVRVNDFGFTPPETLSIRLGLEFPVFKKTVICPFKVSTQIEPDVFTLKADSIPQVGSLVHSAGGFMKFFPQKNNPNQLWVYLKGHVNLRHWLLYETFPLPYIARETGDRIQIIMDNYLKEESRYRSQATHPQAASVSSALKTE